LERDLDPAIAAIELALQEMTRVLLNLVGNGLLRRHQATTRRCRPQFPPGAQRDDA